MKFFLTQTIALVSLFISNSFGQVGSASEDINNIYSANWNVGTEKVLNEHTILRLGGRNMFNFSTTNISYETFSQLKDETLKTSEKKMWSEEKTKTTLDNYEKNAKGGMITLYVERSSINTANTKWFTIIIKDSTDKEIYRKELDDDIPETPNNNSKLWWNINLIYIPNIIEGKFHVYVIDAVSESNGKFNFEVKN